MRHDDHARVRLGDEALQELEAGEIEVVRRLVEEQHIVARQHDRCEGGTSRLPSRDTSSMRSSLTSRPTSWQPAP